MTRPGKGLIGAGDNNRVGRDESEIDDNKVDGGNFKIHQFLYGAKMFLVVSQFFSPVFLIRLGDFWPSSHSFF